ncbi:hypothetical protein [Levilactobacillus tongjiangensis]|uniref:Uncharacterized protein n=1 Tax=Levilactobacillus tongjiangensis TaxID=2486023 RepID=A0ABW1STI1_9LACO|nr:hypothetical protein [Levilactobacillus tongjiangensis]
MSASTEAFLIQALFILGAIVVVGALIALLVARSQRKPLRPMMSVILCGAGLVVIAALLSTLLFKSYDNFQVKKDQYYEITSLTNNMHASLASSRTTNQPVSPQAKKASKNVTYLIKNLKQPKSSVRLAETAQHQLTQVKQPDVQLVRHNYRQILHHYFAQLTDSASTQQRLTKHAYDKVVTYH